MVERWKSSKCRKCGHDYAYRKSECDAQRVGVDVCHTCVFIRKLTMKEIEMLKWALELKNHTLNNSKPPGSNETLKISEETINSEN